MGNKKHFFKRGNLAVGCQDHPKGKRWFAVDFNGFGYWYKREPHVGDGVWRYSDSTMSHIRAGSVGAYCADWQELKFHCAKPDRKPKSPRYFFERENARASWETAPEWARWLAVDHDGIGYWYEGILGQSRGQWFPITSPRYKRACDVGAECPDWNVLVFQRPVSEPEAHCCTDTGITACAVRRVDDGVLGWHVEITTTPAADSEVAA